MGAGASAQAPAQMKQLYAEKKDEMDEYKRQAYINEHYPKPEMGALTPEQEIWMRLAARVPPLSVFL